MKSLRMLLPALAVVGVLLVAGCGSGDKSSGSSSSAAGNPVDRAFVAAMVPHHQSAVQMATIAQRRGSDTFVTQLADNIVRTQTQEISTMRGRDGKLAADGVKKGSLGVPEHMMGMEGDPSSLNSAKPFDGAFLRMMLPHHEGAVVMARAELAKGKDPELKKLAHSIITTQQLEIAGMRKHLGDTGSAATHGSSGTHGAG